MKSNIEYKIVYIIIYKQLINIEMYSYIDSYNILTICYK